MRTTGSSSPTGAPSHHIPEVKFRAYWRVLLSHKWIALLGFVLVMAATVAYLLKTTPSYQAEALLMRQETVDSANLLGNGNSASTSSPIDTQRAILKSILITEPVSEGMAQNGFDITPEEVRDRISLNPVTGGGDMIRIVATASNSAESAALANMAATVYISKKSQLKVADLDRAEKFLNSQMEAVDSQLRQAEEALNIFRQQEGIVESSKTGGSSGLLKQLNDMNIELKQVQNDRQVAAAKLDTARQLIEDKKKEIGAPEGKKLTSQIDQLQSMITNWEVELSLLQQRFSDINPQVVELKQKIALAHNQLDTLFQNLKEIGISVDPMSEWRDLVQQAAQLEIELRGLQQNEDLLKAKIEKYKADHPQLIGKDVELARLERTARIQEQTYLLLIDKLEGIRLLRQMQTVELQVIERATPPESPVKPNRRLTMTLGAMIGLIAGVGAAFFLEAMDDSLKVEEDIEKCLGVPVVGVIPVFNVEKRVLKAIESQRDNVENRDGDTSSQRIKGRTKKQRKTLAKLRGRVLTHLDSESMVTESYRLLRTNIRLTNGNEGKQTILVSGVGQGAGKTLTVANLAITMAKVGIKTLAIDADLRNPKLHHLFHQPRSPGLSEYLLNGNGTHPQNLLPDRATPEGNPGDASLVPINFIRTTEVDNLYLLPSGAQPNNPAELLSSKRMRRLIEDLRSEFGLIIFDSPPLVPVTDATVLASEIADTVLLVVRSGETKREIAQRGQEILERVDANIFGIVLNALDYTKYYSSDYYSYYYDRSRSEG